MTKRKTKICVLSAVVGTVIGVAAFGGPAPLSGYRRIETTPILSEHFKNALPGQIKSLSRSDQSILGTESNRETLLVPVGSIEKLAEMTHQKMHRCGGFIDVTDLDLPSEPSDVVLAKRMQRLGAYPAVVDRADIREGLKDLVEKNIENFVREYSGQFQTRRANTDEGVRAPKWLQARWLEMAAKAKRTDIKVELMPAPSGYSQNSVRITIPGTDPTAPIVVLGGHLDSINQSFWGGSGAKAPGMDDNASGIATLTEVYRVLLTRLSGQKNTIQIFGYSGEELGLLGSAKVADIYSKNKTEVRAVLQFDMTAFPGRSKKVTFMTDYTQPDLTRFTQELYSKYVGLAFQTDKCGYACSDHASWNRYGYPSVMPFEALFKEMNDNIHTSNDVWDGLLDSEFAGQFAKLGYAFAVTLSTQ